ncbi:MAG: hypothetical protein ETSY2_42925 [Candidatus Entotheonella gemina]|uniref:Retrotransposon gag domain-containing protein n=1 Tax=Candidatus Entotheonella gemina TaxID=1429439 RepID=W4LM06_9BACT|nr:MAG: hypothetical protein ETSY2_42925 [Candidatus Entotheonella gemina]
MERVEIYFAANDVPEDKKVPVFLNFIGGNSYAILRSLLAPDTPISKPLHVLVDKLRDHFEPKPSIIAERFKFHRRNQTSGESIAAYIAELRRLSVRCGFPRDYLDDTLRDRFVCGLRSESIQRQLLAEKDLTMTSALEKALNLEAAHRDAQVMKGQTTLPVGHIENRSTASASQTSNTSRGRAQSSRGRGRGRSVRGGATCY